MGQSDDIWVELQAVWDKVTLYGKQLEVYYHTPFTEVGEVVDQSTIIRHLLRWGRKRVKEGGGEEEVREIFTCLYIHTHGDQMDPFNRKPLTAACYNHILS